ncbi:hypothetical protein ABH924_002706 [Arthrobacter sp. GAS37]
MSAGPNVGLEEQPRGQEGHRNLWGLRRPSVVRPCGVWLRGVWLSGAWLRLEPMSSEPEESANISPAVRWGLGAVLFGLLAVSIASAKGEWWTIVGAIACGAAACLFAARAILAARQSR